MQWSKEKGQYDKEWSTNTVEKSKDLATHIPL